MARIKLLKYPKKPKKSASLATMERYISRCKEIDRENARRKAQASRKESLYKKIQGMSR